MMQDVSVGRIHPGPTFEPPESSAVDAALASRAFWKELCDTVGDFMFETDRAGRFVFVAPSEVLGYQAHNLLGHLGSDIVCGWERAGGSSFNPFSCARPMRMQHVWLRKQDGSASLFAMSARPNGQGGVRGVGIDVTADDETVRASAKAVLFQATLDRIVARMREEVLTLRIVKAGLDELADCLGAEGAAVIVDDTADAGPIKTEQSRSITTLCGTGDGWEEISPRLALPDEVIPAADGVARTTVAAGRQVVLVSNETRFGSPSALVVWRPNRLEWRDDERRLTAAVAAALRSAIEQDSLQRQITDHARTDILTGLISQRSFLEETRRRFDRLDRSIEPATMLSLNLDRFSELNRVHGLDRGDEALCQVASMLRDTFRPTDLVCRTVGDQFAVWLDGADMFAAAERAEWLCRNGITVLHDGAPCRLAFSIGLASRPPRSLEDLESLIRRADAAMRQAKKQGGVWHASQQEIET